MNSKSNLSRIVLFGGSSVLTSYLPEEAKHHVVLQALLHDAYPDQAMEIKNWADNGEFIARYLLRGTYEKHRVVQPGIDVAIIRFGTNDQKRMDVAEYHRQMEKFLALLRRDFPGIQIVLETGVYVDFPAHYRFDRNQVLSPYWEVSRQIASQEGLPLVDYFEVGRKETERGNWDLRVRKGLVPDASQDAGKEGDPDWFSDIHPNPLGVKLAAQEEVRVLKRTFPERLPSGQKAVVREAVSNAGYEELLAFSSDRLAATKTTSTLDALQEATRS